MLGSLGLLALLLNVIQRYHFFWYLDFGFDGQGALTLACGLIGLCLGLSWLGSVVSSRQPVDALIREDGE
jgi:hypothetical protein